MSERLLTTESALESGGWRLIPAGEFVMGSRADEPGHQDFGYELQHPVAFERPLLMKATPVIQEEWSTLMGNNPSTHADDPSHPVETVSWFDAVAYCNALSRSQGLPEAYELKREKRKPGRKGYKARVVRSRGSGGYRLPTDAEWEYACRAGTTTAFYNGEYTGSEWEDPALEEIAWFPNNSGGTTHPVGEKLPNAWGLYDMIGNVAEWVWDWYEPFSSKHRVTDPTGPLSSFHGRGIRGGVTYVSSFRCAARYGREPSSREDRLGFRVCRALWPPEERKAERRSQRQPTMSKLRSILRALPETWVRARSCYDLSTAVGVLGANLGREDDDMAAERAAQLLLDVDSGEVSHIPLARLLIPVLIDGLSHPDVEVRRLAIVAFSEIDSCDRHSTVEVFQGNLWERTLAALAVQMVAAEDHEVAVEAARALWLLSRTQGKRDFSAVHGWCRAALGHPHMHVMFFAMLVLTRTAGIKLEWPQLVPPLPDISKSVERHDCGDVSVYHSSFEPRPHDYPAPTADQIRELANQQCGVCGSKNSRLLYASGEDWPTGGGYWSWATRCDDCGCYTYFTFSD